MKKDFSQVAKSIVDRVTGQDAGKTEKKPLRPAKPRKKLKKVGS